MNNLNFLVNVLKESPVFKTLEKNVKPGRTVCASGLSTINKSNIIYALCRLKGVTAFCLASDEKRRRLCAMTFRAWDFVPMFIPCVTSTSLTSEPFSRVRARKT